MSGTNGHHDPDFSRERMQPSGFTGRGGGGEPPEKSGCLSLLLLALVALVALCRLL